MEYAIKRIINIDSEMIEDIIDTAGYGIGYWATTATLDRLAETYTIEFDGEDFSDAPLNSGLVVLTYAKIANAIHKIIDGGVVNDSLTQELNDTITSGEMDIDSEMADCIIQLAIFNEIVYG